MVVVVVSTVPVPVNIPKASLDKSVLPGTGIVPSFADVTLNVFVPVSNNCGGFGVVLGSLKKKVPNKSPQLSVFNLILFTFAIAPLSSPTILAPF